MSTALIPPTPVTPADAGASERRRDRTRQGPRGVTARGVLHSEWLKLVSVRSSTTTLLAAAVVMVGVGALVSALDGGLLAVDDDGDVDPFAVDPTGSALSGTLLAPLIVGVLGVMVITSEYATGTIRPTMTAVPSRLPVIGAKVAVLVAVTAPVMLGASAAAFALGQMMFEAGGAGSASPTDEGVLRAVVGTAGYLTAVALMGLAAGVLLRSTASAISVLVALVFLLPGLGALLVPAGWRDDVLSYLPSEAASAFTSVTARPDLLGPAQGVAVLAAWVLIPLLAAAVAHQRRAV